MSTVKIQHINCVTRTVTDFIFHLCIVFMIEVEKLNGSLMEIV